MTQTIATPNPTASLAPASVEQSLAEVLAEVVGAEQVSPDAPSWTTWAPTPWP